jgi:hypothetical protein
VGACGRVWVLMHDCVCVHVLQYVPPALRPLLANLAGLLWSTFLVVSARRNAPAALPAPKKVA